MSNLLVYPSLQISFDTSVMVPDLGHPSKVKQQPLGPDPKTKEVKPLIRISIMSSLKQKCQFEKLEGAV